MRYLLLLAAALALASGCTLVFDGGGGDDDVCAFAEDTPAIAPAPQRNPDTLECQDFGGPICDPACGPCPAVDLDLAPVSTWGFCGSTCEGLAESACAAAPECRVVKDAKCAVAGGCTTDFLMCLPTDQIIDRTTDCLAARDGFTCSKNPGCTAFHYRKLVVAPDATNILAFATCAPEGRAPGTCYGTVSCLRPPPACPSQHMPAIANGCYTGACLPLAVCEPQPPTP